MNKALKSFVGCVLAGGVALTAHAAEDASLTITPISGTGPYTYQATLTDTGTTAIGSVWYAWVPGQFYLPTAPSSTTPETTGWTTTVVNSGPNSSIQFVDGSGALAAGQSATFDFTTVDSPSALQGNSSDGPPVGTSVAYSGGLFSDGGVQFVATTTPEPSSLALLAASGAGWVAVRLRRRA